MKIYVVTWAFGAHFSSHQHRRSGRDCCGCSKSCSRQFGHRHILAALELAGYLTQRRDAEALMTSVIEKTFLAA